MLSESKAAHQRFLSCACLNVLVTLSVEDSHIDAAVLQSLPSTFQGGLVGTLLQASLRYEFLTSQRAAGTAGWVTIACELCKLDCLACSPTKRVVLNSKLKGSQEMEILKESAAYSPTFGVVIQPPSPAAILIDPSNANAASVDDVAESVLVVPSEPKLNLLSEQALEQEKQAMDQRIEQFARLEAEKYQVFEHRVRSELHSLLECNYQLQRHKQREQEQQQDSGSLAMPLLVRRGSKLSPIPAGLSTSPSSSSSVSSSSSASSASSSSAATPSDASTSTSASSSSSSSSPSSASSSTSSPSSSRHLSSRATVSHSALRSPSASSPSSSASSSSSSSAVSSLAPPSLSAPPAMIMPLSSHVEQDDGVFAFDEDDDLVSPNSDQNDDEGSELQLPPPTRSTSPALPSASSSSSSSSSSTAAASASASASIRPSYNNNNSNNNNTTTSHHINGRDDRDHSQGTAIKPLASRPTRQPYPRMFPSSLPIQIPTQLQSLMHSQTSGEKGHDPPEEDEVNEREFRPPHTLTQESFWSFVKVKYVADNERDLPRAANHNNHNNVTQIPVAAAASSSSSSSSSSGRPPSTTTRFVGPSSWRPPANPALHANHNTSSNNHSSGHGNGTSTKS